MRVGRQRTNRSKQRSTESGAVAVMIAVTATLLIVCLAFAIDLGYGWQVKRSMVKATDAAALAAADTAKSLSNRDLSQGNCPSSVATQAIKYLQLNNTDSSLGSNGFCVITGSDSTSLKPTDPTQSSGLVTVRAKQTATFSFARIFGLNSKDIYSSTTALWQNAPLLPFVGCATKSNLDALPEQVTSDWSGSGTSTLCTPGKSGGYGMINFDSKPTGSTSFDSCKSSNSTYQATLPATFATWLSTGYPDLLDIGDYKCARVGQQYGNAVDAAICKARGRAGVIPLIADNPEQKNYTAGSSNPTKDWIVRITGFALVSVDDYLTQPDTGKCASIAGKPLSGREIKPKKVRLVTARKSAAPGDNYQVTNLPAWPTEITVNTPTTLTVTAQNNQTSSPITDAVLTITLSTSGTRPTFPLPTGNNGLPCTGPTYPGGNGGIVSVAYACPIQSLPIGASAAQSFTFTPVVTNSVTVSVKMTSNGTRDSESTNNSRTEPITVISAPVTTTTTTIAPTTTTIPATTTTIAPIGDFRTLILTYSEKITTGQCCAGLNKFYSYSICAVNVATAALAKIAPPGCLQDPQSNCVGGLSLIHI
jgi:Flp pilus assembly protein TadG